MRKRLANDSLVWHKMTTLLMHRVTLSQSPLPPPFGVTLS